MLNDVTQCFHHSKALLYADDLKVYKSIKTHKDSMELQNDLHRFCDYCSRNRLHLNIRKCFVVTLTRNQNIQKYPYKLQDVILERRDVAKDLGVHLDSKLLYDLHINCIVNKSMKTLGFIIRQCKKFDNIETVKILYLTYVRCQLEYASQLWNPQYDIYISQIDRVQNKFLRYLNYVSGRKFESYNEACTHYKILPLSSRREMADQLFLYKIVNNYLNCPDLTSSLFYLIPSRCSLRYKRLFSVDAHSCKNYVRNGCLFRATTVYNKKYTDLDIFYLSLTQYKNTLLKRIQKS